MANGAPKQGGLSGKNKVDPGTGSSDQKKDCQINKKAIAVGIIILLPIVVVLIISVTALVLAAISLSRVNQLDAKMGELEEMLRNFSDISSQRLVRETELNALRDVLINRIQANNELIAENITMVTERLALQEQQASANIKKLEQLENITGIDITNALERRIVSLNETIAEFNGIIQQLSTQKENLVTQLTSVNESVQLIITGLQELEVTTNVTEASRRIQASLGEVESQQAVIIGQLADAVQRVNSQDEKISGIETNQSTFRNTLSLINDRIGKLEIDITPLKSGSRLDHIPCSLLLLISAMLSIPQLF